MRRASEQREAIAQDRLAEQQASDREGERASGRRAAATRNQLAGRRAADRETEYTARRREAAARDRLAERRAGDREAERALARATERRTARDRLELPPAAPRNPLVARIPAGALSGSLPWLRVTANRITTIDGTPVVLRGIGIAGLDSAPPDATAGFAIAAGLTEAVFDAALGWGPNVVGVAINRDRVLAGAPPWTAWDYLAELDEIVRRAATEGAYTILSLRRLDEVTIFGTRTGPDGISTANLVAPQPDYDTIGVWRLLGERYAGEPAVLFDLYSAPHQRLEDDLTGFDSDWELWRSWVRLMVAELRRMHPRALCIVAGHDWATDLTGFPVAGTDNRPIPNLVYAAHLAEGLEQRWPSVRALSRRSPVLISYWTAGSVAGQGAERTAASLEAEGLGWIAWPLCQIPGAEEVPLVRVAGAGVDATRFGAVVRRALALGREPASNADTTAATFSSYRGRAEAWP